MLSVNATTTLLVVCHSWPFKPVFYILKRTGFYFWTYLFNFVIPSSLSHKSKNTILNPSQLLLLKDFGSENGYEQENNTIEDEAWNIGNNDYSEIEETNRTFLERENWDPEFYPNEDILEMVYQLNRHNWALSQSNELNQARIIEIEDDNTDNSSSDDENDNFSNDDGWETDITEVDWDADTLINDSDSESDLETDLDFDLDADWVGNDMVGLLHYLDRLNFLIDLVARVDREEEELVFSLLRYD